MQIVADQISGPNAIKSMIRSRFFDCLTDCYDPVFLLLWMHVCELQPRIRLASQSAEASAAIERTAAEQVWLFVTLYLYLPSAKGAASFAAWGSAPGK